MVKKQETTVDDLKAMNVYQRMLEAQRLFSYVQKDSPKGLQYSVVTHDAVTKKARAALMAVRLYAQPTVLEHGQEANRTWARVQMRIVNIDDPEDEFFVTMFGYGNDSQDKGPGKSISYAVKYCFLKAFGAETGDDADLESVEFEKPKTKVEITAAIKAACAKHGLDYEYVLTRISDTYGPLKEIPIDILEVIPVNIDMSPENYAIPVGHEGEEA